MIGSSYGRAQRSTAEDLRQARDSLQKVVPDDCAAPKPEDFPALRGAAEVFRAAGDGPEEARALTVLGALYDRTAQYRAAIPVLDRAVRIATNDRIRVQAETLLADALQSVNRAPEALTLLRGTIDRAHRMGDSVLEADALRIRGETQYSQNPARAMADLSAALALASDDRSLRVRAEILNDQGAIASDSHNPAQALSEFHEALRIDDQINDCRDEAEALTNLASLDQDRGQSAQALEDYSRAIPLERRTGDRDAESKSLHALAKMHQDLGDLPRALRLYEQALAIEQKTGDIDARNATRLAIAGVYESLHEPQRARKGYLAIVPGLRGATLAMALNNLGMAEADLGHTAAARLRYRQAMVEAAKVKDVVTPAYSAWGIGELEQADALENDFRALRTADQMDMPDLEGLVSTTLMNHFRQRRMPDLAIFFGKQAVDDYQALRANLGGMPDSVVSSFVQEKAQTYRTLARLLIDEGRLNEAQQVLDLLKVQQYADYMQWQGDIPSSKVLRTRSEKRLEDEYRSQAARLTAAQKAGGDVVAADRDMAAFLNQLPHELRSQAAGTEQETDAQKALDAVLASQPNTAIIYTLVNDDRYTAIVVTRGGRAVRSYPIARATLDAQCHDFLELLRNHRPQTKAAAAMLFRILAGPVEHDIENSGARTLVWSLDGPLRFIPVSALFNPRTEKYLVESYSLADYTPLGHLDANPPQLARATAIAMGISDSYDPALAPLPNVPQELDAVVSDSRVRGSDGPLTGTILLNDQFTRSAMEEAVRSQTVVHIASHFVLEPGNDSLSWLELGGRQRDPTAHRLSLADFKQDRKLRLDRTELVTLSACQTGAENLRDDGVVMEGLSEAVLDKQARAVIASLWQVNDQSTAILMARFYRLWIGSGGKISKSEALRQAQMDLIAGRLQTQGERADRGLTTTKTGPGRFSDPYYWAPFVLTGNWQ